MSQYKADPLSACCGDPGDCNQAHLYCFNRNPKEANTDAMKSFDVVGPQPVHLGNHQMELTKEAVAREAQPSPIQQAINEATQGSVAEHKDQMAAFDVVMGRDQGVLAALAKDDIKRPDHYARFAIEPCTFIMLNELPYWAGNVVKYVSRAPHKHKDERVDIRKAIRYCEMRIEELDRVAAGTDGNVIGNPL